MCQTFCSENANRGHRPQPLMAEVQDEGTLARMKCRTQGLRLLELQVATLFLALGCMPVPPHPQIDSLEEGFSGRLATAHMESLAGLYPRLPGSENDEIARAYLTREFRGVNAKTRVLANGDRRQLVAEFQGVSDDVVLLVAAYPALESGVWIDDSGAALLLEFARVMGSPRPPYTLVLALAETRPVLISRPDDQSGENSSWQPIPTPLEAQGLLAEAGRSLAEAIEAEGEAGRVRAVVVFDTSADADLRVARDLRSHPEFRKLFWESAAALEFDSMFPPDGRWASPDSLHLGFRERSMDRVLALIQVEEVNLNPLGARSANQASPGMFDSIGVVTVDALSKLMRRFEKVDAFSR